MYAIQGHEKTICSFAELKSHVVQTEDWRSESHCRQGTIDLNVLLLEGELSKHPLCSQMTVGLHETADCFFLCCHVMQFVVSCLSHILTHSSDKIVLCSARSFFSVLNYILQKPLLLTPQGRRR